MFVNWNTCEIRCIFLQKTSLTDTFMKSSWLLTDSGIDIGGLNLALNMLNNSLALFSASSWLILGSVAILYKSSNRISLKIYFYLSSHYVYKSVA